MIAARIAAARGAYESASRATSAARDSDATSRTAASARIWLLSTRAESAAYAELESLLRLAAHASRVAA